MRHVDDAHHAEGDGKPDRREQQHHATAARLAAALDQVDIGIVLLDADTRAEFINRAFRDYFALSDAQADSTPEAPDEPVSEKARVTFMVGDPEALARNARDAAAVAEGVFFTRDLVNEPANV